MAYKDYMQPAQIFYPTQLLFNVKITDLTTVENRFVILSDRKLDENGFIKIIDESEETDENDGYGNFQLN